MMRRTGAIALILLLTACSAQPVPQPSPAAPSAALPSPAPVAPTTRLGTFFFYWYNCPLQECDASQLSVLPPGWASPLPDDPDPRDGSAYSSLNYDWFEGELRDISATGVDVVFPVSWGDHPHDWFRQDRMGTLVQANSVIDRPLEIGLFLDSTAEQAAYNERTSGTYRFQPGDPQLPLSDPLSGYYFYDMHIKAFFDHIPRAMWATEQGRPIIIAYTAQCCKDLQLAGTMWDAVKAAFQRDFGVEPWLILEDTWFGPESTAPGGDLRPISAVADGRYSWGTALNGPASRSVGGYTVSSVGPGFDNRRITGVASPRYQPRDTPPGGGPLSDGAFLRGSLAAVPADTDLLVIETWNEWPESTGIARAGYRDINGQPLPDDFYMQIVRRWKAGLP